MTHSSRPQRVEVEQHADGDEEQAEQDVAEWPDDAFDLVAVFGFGQHHSREEAAERHREPRHCEAQAEASATSSTASVNNSRSRLLAMTYSSGRSSQRPAASTTRTAAVPAPTSLSASPRLKVSAARRQRRGEREERHHGDVLEQHHAEGEPPVSAIELGAFGEPLHDEHRGAHGHHATEHDALRPVDSEQAGDQRHHGGRAEHLQRPQAEHLAAQRHHARPGEFQAQGEQQEDHAQLGQQMRGVGLGECAHGMRAQDQPDGDVAEDGRQSHATRERHDENRRG